MAGSQPTSKHWTELHEKIVAVLNKHDPKNEGIRISAFWIYFKKIYTDLPEVAVFSVSKRGELLKKSSVCEVFEHGNDTYVKLVTVKPKQVTGNGGNSVVKVKVTRKEPRQAAKSKSAGNIGTSREDAIQRAWKDVPVKEKTPEKSHKEASKKEVPREDHVISPTLVPEKTQGKGPKKLSQKDCREASEEEVDLDFPPLGASQEDMHSRRNRQQRRGPYPPPNQGERWKHDMADSQLPGPQPPQPMMFYNTNQQQMIPQLMHQQHMQHHHQPHQHQQNPNAVPQHQAARHQNQPSRAQVSREQLGRTVETCIEQLVEKKEQVSVKAIEQHLLEHYNVDSLSKLGIQKIEHIPRVSEMLRTACKVNMYVQAFVQVRSIVTVHELAESLKEYVHENKDFEQLQLGPLLKQQVVYDYFKMPGDAEITEINTWDVLVYLRDFLSKNDAWTKRDNDLAEFMEFVTEKRGLDNPYKLGLRMRSLPLAISILKKSQRDWGQTLRSTMAHLKEGVEQDLTKAFRVFQDSVLYTEGGLCEVKREYLQMNARDVTEEVLQKLTILYQTIHNMAELCNVDKTQRKTLSRLLSATREFTARLRESSTARHLFQIAVSCSRDELHSQLTAVLHQLQITPENRSAVSTSDPSKPMPPTSEVIKHLLSLLGQCLYQGPLTLTHLTRVEVKLLETFQFTHFRDMTSHTFLSFLLTNDRVKKYLEETGGLSLTSSSATTHHGYQPPLSDLTNFLHQCQGQTQATEDALCYHYGVQEVTSLGQGSYTHLVAVKDKQKVRNSNVHFESALTSCQSVLYERRRKTGVLGSVTREQAICCLQNCPLLEDLSEWSQWELVFEPELGSLKDFLHKVGGQRTTHVMVSGHKALVSTSFVALETRPGRLLKLSCNASPEKFSEASRAADARTTAGQLMSIIVTNKGVTNTPLTLLANHVKTALLLMNARTPGAPGQESRHEHLVHFILSALLHLPLVTCQAVANQVFLDPLSSVIGQKSSKDLLLKHADTPPLQNRLQSLGMLLGVGEWRQNFEQRLAVPQECVEQPEQIDLGQGNILTLDPSSESESEDSESESDSDIEFLSDVEEVEVTSSMTSESEVVSVTSESEVVATEQMNESEDGVEEIKNTAVSGTEVCDSGEDLSDKDKSAEEPTEKNPQRDLISLIRREEFSVDIELAEGEEQRTRKLHERMGRSLQRLSKDLYSKDTHFVLELIQNADDNDYSPAMTGGDSDEKPTLEFYVDSDKVIVSNNECGFEEKNIRAICDVGKSTKNKHMAGYIGQKGIGFKSVFRVTDRPEIHSNDFHFCFDVNSGPMGYILPHWIDQSEDTTHTQHWTTRIVLPLKSDAPEQISALSARFHDIQPSLLLFLHRLRAITIVMATDNNVDRQEMVRRDIGDNVIELSHSGGVDRWLVIRKTLDASTLSSKAKSDTEVESTEIALAFPLISEENVAAKVLPGKQPVFAFLPLRSYGFRFIVQADFDVPSSREDVDKSSVWNQWLCSELHAPFIDALNLFKEAGDCPVQGVCRLLQFIPTEDEILGFFRPVATSILNELRATACLPTRPTKNGAGTSKISWKIPSQLVISSDHLVKEVVTSELLWRRLSLDYLHDDVAAMLNPNLVTSLGIQTLTSEHLLEVGLDLQQRAETEGVELSVLAKYLCCVYRSLDELHPDPATLDRLRGLAIMPLSDGTYVSLNQMNLFFPLENRGQTKRKKGVLSQLELSLATLHPALLSSVSNVISSQVEKLLDTVGVKRHTPHDIIHHHIIPALSQHNALEISPRLLVAYVIYIKEQLAVQAQIVDLSQLGPLLVVLTNHGPCRPADHPVHFTPEYGTSIDLARDLPGYRWQLLDPCYIQHNTALERHQWHQFFSSLGVLDFLHVSTETVTMTRAELLQSRWVSHDTKLLPQAESYVVEDKKCQQFTDLVSHNLHPETLRLQMTNLFVLMSTHWESLKNLTLSYLRSSEGHQVMVDTSFCQDLKDLAWIPSSRIEISEDDATGKIELSQVDELNAGKTLFVQIPQITSIFGPHVTYMENIKGISGDCPLVKFLGVKVSFDVDFLKAQLRKWSERMTMDDDPKPFKTNMEQMTNIYTYLYRNLSPAQLNDLFHTTPLIFLPNSVPENRQEYLRGAFYNRNEVRWNDPTKLFHLYYTSMSPMDRSRSYRRAIRIYYQDFKDFFVRSGEIQEQPSVADYTVLLIHITSTAEQSHVLKEVLLILHTIAQMVREAGPNAAEIVYTLKTAAKSHAVLPTKNGEFVSLEKKPMMSDDKVKEKMFRSAGSSGYQEGVYFIETGEKTMVNQNKSTSDLTRLLNALDIATLTSCLEVETTTESYRSSRDLQLYMTAVVPYIHSLLFHDHHEIYKELHLTDIAEKLLRLQCASVGKLEAVYNLSGRTTKPVIVNQVCHMTAVSLDVHADHVTNYRQINRSIAEFFSRGDTNCSRDLKSLLDDLQDYLIDRRVEPSQDFMDDHNLLPVPAELPQWRVTPPRVVYEPKPPPTYTPPMEEVEMTMDHAAHSGGGDGQEAGGGLKSWPPKSNPAAIGSTGKTKSSEVTQWPPPPPPAGSQPPPGPRPPAPPSNTPRTPTTPGDDPNKSTQPKPGPKHPPASNQQDATKPGEETVKSAQTQEAPTDTANTPTDSENQSENEPIKPSEDAEMPAPEASSAPIGQPRVSMATTANQPIMFELSGSKPTNDGQRKRARVENEDGGYLHNMAVRGRPSWAAQVPEVEYEELGTGDTLPVPTEYSLERDAERQQVALWGEILVKQYLEALLDDPQSPVTMVTWTSESENPTAPYDFHIRLQEPTEQGEYVVKDVFIEVKTTTSENKAFCEISLPEVNFAQEKEGDFHLYRVFNAGHESKVKLSRVEDVAGKILNKQIKLCLVV